MKKKAYISVNRNEVMGPWPIRVSIGKHGKAMRAHHVDINGPSKLVAGSPMPWGARIWIEADPKDVELHNAE